MQLRRHNVQAAAGQNGFPRGADGGMADQARAARVDTDDLFIVGPQRHQRFEVGTVQGIVERRFDFGGAALSSFRRFMTTPG